MAMAPGTAKPQAGATPGKVAITAADTPHIRVGLRWDPKEIDHLKFITASRTAGGAFFQLGVEAGFGALYNVMHSSFTRKVADEPKTAGKFEKKAEEGAVDKLKHFAKVYEEDYSGPSYNLDLLCFTYGKDKKLLHLVSPTSLISKNAGKAELSILHSGDDTDGVGVGWDEELLITTGDIPAEVETVVFVIASETCGFNKVKGGACGLIRTQDETELLHGTFESGGETDMMVFATMRRTPKGWDLEKLAKFATIDEDKDSPLDDSVEDIVRNKFL